MILENLSLIFIISSLVIILTPGQDMVLVMSRSLSAGPCAGIATAGGVSVGLMGHTLLATFGLGAILSSSAVIFTLIKYIGAVYLIWLGIRMISSSTSQLGYGQSQSAPKLKMFYQGMISNISNPKITLFYFAYLPQFIHKGDTSHALSLFFLGTFFAVLTFIVKAPIGYCAGRLSTYLRSNPKILRGIYRSSGLLLIGLGVRLALSHRE